MPSFYVALAVSAQEVKLDGFAKELLIVPPHSVCRKIPNSAATKSLQHSSETEEKKLSVII